MSNHMVSFGSGRRNVGRVSFVRKGWSLPIVVSGTVYLLPARTRVRARVGVESG